MLKYVSTSVYIHTNVYIYIYIYPIYILFLTTHGDNEVTP